MKNTHRIAYGMLFLVLTHAIPSYSQENCTLSISGQVLDEHKKEPLPFTNVYIKEISTGVVSDSTGNYIIRNLCPGTFTILCQHIGCSEIESKIVLTRDTVINFHPEHHAHQLRTVSIIETSNHKHSQTITNSSWKAGNMPFTEMLKILPGVTSLSTGSTISKPAIQGLYGSRVSIIQDGVKIEGQSWGLEHAPEVSAATAGEIEVVKGGGALKFSHENLGGAIIIKPKVLRSTPGVSGDVSTGFNSNGKGTFNALHLEGVSKKYDGLGMSVQAAYNKHGNMHTPDYTLENTGGELKNLSWRLKKITENRKHEISYSYLNTENGIFEGSHFENLTDLKNIINNNVTPEDAEFTYNINPPSQAVLHEIIKYEGSEKIKKETLYANISRQYDKRQEFGEHGEEGEPEVQFELTTYQLIAGNTHTWKENTTTDLGINIRTMKNTWEHEFFIPNYSDNSAGLYLIHKFFIKKIPLETAVRFDKQNRKVYLKENEVIEKLGFKYEGLSGALSGHKELSNHYDLYFSGTTAWRSPTVNEQFANGIHHGNAAFEIGNLSLDKEQSFNLEMGVERTGSVFTGDISLYANTITNYIYLLSEQKYTLTNRGAYPVYSYRQTDVMIKGIDGMVNYTPVKYLSFAEKFSFLSANELNSKRFIPGFPPPRISSEVTIQPSKGISIFHELNLTTGFQYVFKQTRTDPREELAKVPPAYYLLNMELSGDFNISKMHVDFNLSVNNILNQRYRDYTDRFRYFSDAPGRNFIISFKIPFDIP